MVTRVVIDRATAYLTCTYYLFCFLYHSSFLSILILHLFCNNCNSFLTIQLFSFIRIFEICSILGLVSCELQCSNVHTNVIKWGYVSNRPPVPQQQPSPIWYTVPRTPKSPSVAYQNTDLLPNPHVFLPSHSPTQQLPRPFPTSTQKYPPFITINQHHISVTDTPIPCLS